MRSVFRRAATASVAVLLVAGASTCATHDSVGSASRPKTTATSTLARATDPTAVPAVREPLATDSTAAVTHDNETMALAAHAGRLFAATDQWMYGGAHAAGQVLVKDTATRAWRVFEPTQSLRVEALDSFPIPENEGLGGGHALLVTQAIVDGRSRIQWLLDNAHAFSLGDSYVLPSRDADVRAFGAHEDHGVWAVYAGVEPTGILRGTWSPATRTLVFDPTPELTALPPASAGIKAQKVTGFADCAGALYVSINTKLYRRDDGDLRAGVPRWSLVYEAPPVGQFNSGLRGLTCITHNHSPVLVASTEGNGNFFRFDDLPRGRRPSGAPRLVPTLEFAPIPAIRAMLAAHGTTVPTVGTGSIAYVIAAYNNVSAVTLDGADRELFGFEWAYVGGCAPTRRCGPTAFKTVTFDAAACFAVRTDRAPSPRFELHCLNGRDFTPAPNAGKPIRGGEAFVSIRAIQSSPFDDGQLYFAGYDCNFFPADGTAWIAHTSSHAIHLDHV